MGHQPPVPGLWQQATVPGHRVRRKLHAAAAGGSGRLGRPPAAQEGAGASASEGGPGPRAAALLHTPPAPLHGHGCLRRLLGLPVPPATPRRRRLRPQRGRPHRVPLRALHGQRQRPARRWAPAAALHRLSPPRPRGRGQRGGGRRTSVCEGMVRAQGSRPPRGRAAAFSRPYCGPGPRLHVRRGYLCWDLTVLSEIITNPRKSSDRR